MLLAAKSQNDEFAHLIFSTTYSHQFLKVGYHIANVLLIETDSLILRPPHDAGRCNKRPFVF